jgi:hypothetical protein
MVVYAELPAQLGMTVTVLSIPPVGTCTPYHAVINPHHITPVHVSHTNNGHRHGSFHFCNGISCCFSKCGNCAQCAGHSMNYCGEICSDTCRG